MKSLAIISLLALAASQADAGGLKIGLGFGDSPSGKSWQVRVGYSNDRHVAPTHRRRGHVDQVYVRGHFDTVERRVWVKGHHDRVYHPAEYGFRYVRGCRVRVVIRAAHYDNVFHPGHFETRREKVWVPGRYELVRHHGSHHRVKHVNHNHRVRDRISARTGRGARNDRAARGNRGSNDRASRNNRGSNDRAGRNNRGTRNRHRDS